VILLFQVDFCNCKGRLRYLEAKNIAEKGMKKYLDMMGIIVVPSLPKKPKYQYEVIAIINTRLRLEPATTRK
jgi:hypothetical protein